MKKWIVVVGLGAVAALPFACGGKVGEALRPADPTALHAMNEDGTGCTAGSTSQPLVIDLSSAERTDLELAMRHGVMVVSYDCKSLRLVKGCQLEGSYVFAAVVPKEDLVQIKNADELLANMPISGAKFEAEIKAGSSIDLVLVTIGQRGATLLSAAKSELKGPECKSATHFVRAAYVGGFSMTKNTSGNAKVGAQAFGATANAASGSDKKAAAHDGDLDVCRSSSADATKPPDKCQSPLRIELVPIGAERVADETQHQAQPSSTAAKTSDPPVASASAAPPANDEKRCTPPMVWTGTMCAKQADAPHQCNPKDEAECTAQCNAGHAGSCYSLGQLNWKDTKKATELFDKACQGREARGCFSHAMSLVSERNASKDDAQKALLLAAAQKDADASCAYGDGWSCYAVANWHAAGFTFPKDQAKSATLMKRSCDLGYASGCLSLANLYIAGDKGLSKDTAQASTLLSRACESGNASHCERLGTAYQKGELGAKEPQKALDAFGKACDVGGMRACASAGQILRTGDGVPADAVKAKDFFERGCTQKTPGWDACLALGEIHEKAGDKAKAAEAYARGCMLGACARAAAIYEKGDGVKADAAKAVELYTRACANGDVVSCDKLGALLERTDKDKAKEHYLRICTQRMDAPSCDSAKRLGATVPPTVKPIPRPIPKPPVK